MTDTVDIIANVVQAASVIVISVPICIGIWYHQKQKRNALHCDLVAGLLRS